MSVSKGGDCLVLLDRPYVGQHRRKDMLWDERPVEQESANAFLGDSCGGWLVKAACSLSQKYGYLTKSGI